MTAPALWIDGHLTHPDAPYELRLDDGLVRGDGVFEGLRAYNRTVRTLEAHLDRMEASAHTVRLPFDRDAVRAAIQAVAAAATSADCAIRAMLTRGGQLIVREEPLLPAEPAAWALCPVAHRVTPLLLGAKTLSYAANMQAQRLAASVECDTALLVRADDDVVLECPVASFAWLEGEQVCMPPLAVGVLDSITRRLLMECVEVTTVERTTAEIAEARGALVVSTVLESRAVRAIRGVGGFSSTNPRVLEVQQALRQACRSADADAARGGFATT